MHSYPRNLVIIGRAVVYYARSAHAFSAGIKCQHCTCTPIRVSFEPLGLFVNVVKGQLEHLYLIIPTVPSR